MALLNIHYNLPSFRSQNFRVKIFPLTLFLDTYHHLKIISCLKFLGDVCAHAQHERVVS